MKNTIFITGSSSGIGKATARLFQEKGWNVVATMRTPDKEEKLTKLDNVLVTGLDVQDQPSIDKAVKLGIEKFGKIDVLMNNAAYGAYGPLEAFSTERIRRQFDVNVLGLIDVTKALLPHFRMNKSGTVINISSIGGIGCFPLGTLYNGSKFAVEGLSEALHFELEAIGCKMKIVQPGVFKTEFAKSRDIANDKSLSEYQEIVGKVIQARRTSENLAEPSVVAEVIYQAATDGTDQLRYTAGEDAKIFMKNRKKMDDKTFLGIIKKQFGL